VAASAALGSAKALTTNMQKLVRQSTTVLIGKFLGVLKRSFSSPAKLGMKPLCGFVKAPLRHS
jgi:hypothetical protein